MSHTFNVPVVVFVEGAGVAARGEVLAGRVEKIRTKIITYLENHTFSNCSKKNFFPSRSVQLYTVSIFQKFGSC